MRSLGTVELTLARESSISTAVKCAVGLVACGILNTNIKLNSIHFTENYDPCTFMPILPRAGFIIRVFFIPTAYLKRLALGAYDRTKETALAPARGKATGPVSGSIGRCNSGAVGAHRRRAKLGEAVL